MVEIRAQAPHPGQGVADRLGEFGLAGDLWQPGLQPGFQSIEDRFGAGLPELDPLNGHTAAGILLDDVEPGDALDGFLGDDRALRLEDIGELAPDMGHAGDFIDITGSVELVEPGIAVRMHLVGCFEGIDSGRGLEWRGSDSLSLREFLRLESRDRVPDHCWLSKTRTRLPHEVHAAVFDRVLARVAGAGLVKGDRIGVDASTMEANAALRNIVRRDTG